MIVDRDLAFDRHPGTPFSSPLRSLVRLTRQVELDRGISSELPVRTKPPGHDLAANFQTRTSVQWV
jgi:hypothetical protein